MLLAVCVTVYFLHFTTHAKKTTRSEMGPPCYGRSNCVSPFKGSGENTTVETTTENALPKRYIVVEEFKSPIFGAYKYDPLLDDFIMPNKTTLVPGNNPNQQPEILLRAFDDEPKIEEPTSENTTKPESENALST